MQAQRNPSPRFYGPTFPVSAQVVPAVGQRVRASYRLDNTGERCELVGVVTAVRDGNFGPRNPAGATVPVVYLDTGRWGMRLDATNFEAVA